MAMKKEMQITIKKRMQRTSPDMRYPTHTQRGKDRKIAIYTKTPYYLELLNFLSHRFQDHILQHLLYHSLPSYQASVSSSQGGGVVCCHRYQRARLYRSRRRTSIRRSW